MTVRFKFGFIDQKIKNFPILDLLIKKIKIFQFWKNNQKFEKKFYLKHNIVNEIKKIYIFFLIRKLKNSFKIDFLWAKTQNPYLCKSQIT